MGKKIIDYMPTMTQDITNKVVLYRRCSCKMASGVCAPKGDGCSSCPNYLPRADFMEAMRIFHMIGKRKLKYKKIPIVG